MSRQLSSPLIAVSLSTRKTMMPAWMALQSAAVAGVDGLDVDATSPIGAWLGMRQGNAPATNVPVRSVWLAVEELDSLRSRRFIEAVLEHQPNAHPQVVALLPNATTLRDLTRNFEPRSF